ncbi:peptidoglycan DD-metalloendopeptidase family protein [Agathobaculum sp.]|uniref:peptidoglycan DD-metalloendopeptidase family protein n=1 Tax=Agathobaculum sp. TaxID=2048138 RepID=UPI003AEFBBEE
MSFYSDYEKKKNKNKTSALLKVPQVVLQKPAKQDNSRRATAARNREQQRVQAHQNAQRPASTYLTGGSTTRSQPYAANQQRNTVFQQRGNTRQGLSGTGSRSTQQNNVRQPASTYLTGGSVTRSQPYAASQQNQLFSARKAAEQRRNPRQNVSTATKSSGDGNALLTQFLKNSMDWHTTSDPNRKAQLHAQNDALRRKLGYEYNPQTGASFDKYGHEMTAGVRMAYGSKPTERLNQATQLLHTSGVMGKTDKATVYPTAMQAAQGLDEDYFSGQTGYNAHKTMHDLFNRSDETWSSEDTQSRDRARQELSNEMRRIMERYGLDYQPRDNADDIMHRLKAAGADENTLAYVQENIDLRHAADRLGNSMEAVGKRWIASIPSYIDTAKQDIADRNDSLKNDEYNRLVEQEQQLELQLANMSSQDADGKVPADYQAVYDQLQDVRKRKNEVKVSRGVDPNKWSQRMLREASQAQANAEAGLAPAPRWLTEQTVSVAGNLPTMAMSAIPGIGPVVGSVMTGMQAAGQRSFELNEQGKTAGESLARGTVSGVIEAATEKLPLEQMSKILHSGGTNAVKNILRQMGTEATEESASYFLNYVADLAANDPDAKFSLAELTQSAAGGAFGGLVFGAAGALGAKTADEGATKAANAYDYERNQAQQLVQLDSELQAALKLPEGPIRERAVQTAQNKMADKISGLMTQQAAQNAELTANYDADLDNRMSLAQRAQAAEWEQQHTTSIDTNPATHTPEQMKLINEYVNSIDDGLKDFADHYYENPNDKFGRYTISKVDDKQAEALREIFGQDFSDYRNAINKNGIIHIANRHGLNGEHDSSMQNTGDIARAGYVIENFDSVERVFNGDGSPAYSTEFRDKNNQLAPLVKFTKKIDGSYYVVEAVPDTRYKKLWIVSAYMSNNNSGDVTQVPNAAAATPSGTPEASLASLSPLNTSIQQNAENSNGLGTKTVNTMQDAMQYGKTPEQAVMEEQARAEGERTRNGYEKGETMSFMTGTKMGYPSDTVSPDGSDIPSVDNSISPNAENGNTEVKPLGNYEMYGKSRKQAMRELQNKLTEKRSFLHDDDYKQVRAVQSAELRETWEQARPVHDQIEKFQKNHPLSAKDEQLLQAAMVNGATDTFSQCDDPAAVMHRYQLQQELNRRMQPIKDYQRTRGETMALNAEEMADTIAEFAKDKKIPGAYSRETMERNSYDIFGKNNRDKAEQLNDEYFAPVHKAVADRTNYVNTMRQQVADLHLSKHESALVQMALEGRNDVAAEYIKNNKIKVTSELQKHVADGVATFQAIYKELYDSLNETLLSNGMEPVRARKNYAPHFVKDKPDTLLSRIRYKMGWGKDSSVNIGTDLAGITDDFSPGKKWFGNLLQRKSELTDYDAVAGFDRYIETAGDVIFLTDSVQQLRSLEDALRYRLSDEGTREKVNQIRNDRSLNALERHQKIQDAYDSNTDNIQKLYNQKKQGMGGYVSNLHEYINNLAGKKARADRGWEEMIGRQMYTVAKNVEGRVAANMIAMNPGSWITNFIPITQAGGEVSTANLIKAMRDTVKSAVKDDGFTDGSVFLTNREGTQFLDRTLTRKISDIAGMPMEAIDHFTSNVVTRAKYLQNIQNGMDVQEAFDNADTFAANLMADRSKGAQPTAFNSVNPVRKVFTMFQLEVNNQLSYLFKDLPRAKQSVPKLAWAYTKVFTGAYLFNAVYHQLTGRDSAFDPISIVGDAFDLDPLELIAEAFGLGDDDDKDKKKKSGVDIALDLGKNVAEQVPFVGGLLGGGRVPISSAFPDFGKLIEEHENGYDNKRIALDAAKSAANSAAYLLLPFGGGALKRTAEGAATVYAGGSYSLDKNGEKILQFPQYGQSPRDWAQAMLFGKSSLPGAQEWADNGYDSLNAEETKAFDELRQHMNWFKDENGNTIDNSEAVFAAIKAMRAITDEMKEKYPDDYTAIAAGKKREMLFNDNDLNEIQKKYLDRELIGSSVGASGDYSSRDMFDISQKVREARQDDAMEALKHGISVDEFASWDGIIEETLADNEVDAKDFVEGQNNELYKKNEALLAILNEYGNSGEHTDAEKNAFADYLLISAMEDSDKERWDEVKGTVNATDFVKFASDMTTYNKEYKGSGLSKSDAMQSILDGYKNLSDTQKDALFGVYSDSASGNAFHISKYEEAIKDNSFYSYLKDAGKKELRSLLNSYEKHVADNAKLDGWEAKAAVAKEAGISPGIYALFQVALQEADTDGKGLSQAKAKAAVESVGGLTQAQKAYLWQSANKSWEKNPYGSATVSEYKYAGGEFANPVAGGTISSKFGPRDTFATSNGASSSRWHKSIDIAAPAGTAIKSVQGGKVTANGWVSGYGWTIEVTHDNGYKSMYHHMQNQSSVAVGTEVKQGQTIGNVGSTGNSTGPHLDLTITKDGTPVDPASLIGDYKNAKTGYVYEGSPVYTQLSSAAGKKSSSGGSRKSGGSSSGGLKQLKGLSGLKGLGF